MLANNARVSVGKMKPLTLNITLVGNRELIFFYR